MKEHESDVGQDLDAGWDEIEADVTSVSVKTKVAEALVKVADLDAGWDIDEAQPQAQSPKRKDGDRVSKAKPQKASQAAAVVQEAIAAPALTKKARRELDRQNQIHASKRKSEAKALRKQQRLVPKAEPAEAPRAKLASASNQSRSKKSMSKRRRLHQPAPPPKMGTSPGGFSAASDPITRHEPNISIHSRSSSPVEPPSAHTGNWRWWAFGIALAIVLWVAARWIFSG